MLKSSRNGSSSLSLLSIDFGSLKTGKDVDGKFFHSDQHPIDTLRNIPLEPLEYCRRWVTPDPNRNYRKACINAIAQATGLSPQTIKDWGQNFYRRPQYVLRLLRYADLINQFRQLAEDRQITLPPDFPKE